MVLATGNPGCLMQIGAGLIAAGLDIAVAHPVELLDESYRQVQSHSERSEGARAGVMPPSLRSG
jgi:glycolate oxidase iron-sulfur subunit